MNYEMYLRMKSCLGEYPSIHYYDDDDESENDNEKEEHSCAACD